MKATPRRWLFAAVTGAALVVVLMAACSGGGSSGKNADAKELDALAAKFSKTSFKADYTLTSTSSEEPLNGTLVLYKDGADRFRFDITSQQDGQNTTLTLIDDKDSSIFCLDDAGDLAPILGVEPGKGVCIKNDPNDSAGGLTDVLQNFKDLASSDTTVTNKSTRDIAGQDARCFDYQSKGSSDRNQTCFSSDGVPLYDNSQSDSDTTTMEATRLEGTVPPDAFKVPYEIKELPDFTGGDTPTP